MVESKEFLKEEYHSGPLPSPSTIQHYDAVVPGAAERILQMAEREAAFSHEISFQALNIEADERKRGQVFGLAIGIGCLLFGGAGLLLGYPWVAGIAVGSTMGGLVTVFVTGRVWPEKVKQKTKPEVDESAEAPSLKSVPNQ